MGHFTDAADVLLPVLRREAQVTVQPVSDVVSVQNVDLASLFEELGLKLCGDRRLAAARKTGQPDDASFMTVLFLPVFLADACLVPGHVRACLPFRLGLACVESS